MTIEENTPVAQLHRPLRVLIGCDTFTPDVNGAARFTERLAAGLVKRGIDVQVAAPSATKKDFGERIETIEGVDLTVHRLRSRKLWGHDWLRFVMPIRARTEARRLLDTFQPDVVHIQSHILVGRGLAREAKKRGIRIIATNHVMPENLIGDNTLAIVRRLVLKWGWRDEDRVLSLAERITTPTQRAADFLESNTSRRGVLPVSCGIEAADYTPSFEPRLSNRVVFVGRINLEKQIEVVLRALTHLDPVLNVHFDIVGGGDQRENLEQLSQELGVNDRVVWHGRLPDDELRATLTRGSVFTIASVAELQSIATLEAMASGLPILAANAMALPHLVNEGSNGYLFEPGNDQMLAELISKVIQLSHEDYEKMQLASLDMVRAHDIERTLNTFEALYRGQEVVQ